MARTRLVSGASVTLYVNGKPFGIAEVIDWVIDTPVKEIHGLDQPEPYELAPTVAKVSGTLRVYRIQREGGAEGAGLAAPISQLPRARYFTMQLIERDSEAVLFQTDRALVTRQAWKAAVKSIVQGTISFVAIGASNEVGG